MKQTKEWFTKKTVRTCLVLLILVYYEDNKSDEKKAKKLLRTSTTQELSVSKPPAHRLLSETCIYTTYDEQITQEYFFVHYEYPLTEASFGCWWWLGFRLELWLRPARPGVLRSVGIRPSSRRARSPCHHRAGLVCSNSFERHRRATWWIRTTKC